MRSARQKLKWENRRATVASCMTWARDCPMHLHTAEYGGSTLCTRHIIATLTLLPCHQSTALGWEGH